MNLEGRLQRLRRTVLPPRPDELAWLAKLGARFGVEVAPEAAGVYAELAAHLFRDLPLDELGRSPFPRDMRTRRPRPDHETRRLPGRRPLRRRAPAPAVQRAVLGTGGRAGPEPGPAPRARGRALRRRRGAARDRVRRHRARPLERHLGRARARVSRSSSRAWCVAGEHAGELHATVEVKAT